MASSNATLAVVSDIHGNLPALEAVLADIRSRGVSRIVCTGDLVNYGPFPNQVIERVQEAGIPVVQGNHDRAVGTDQDLATYKVKEGRDREAELACFAWTKNEVEPRHKAYLAGLPATQTLKVGKEPVLFCHGSPRSPSEYLRADLPTAQLEAALEGVKEKAVVCGHTHQPVILRLPSETFLFNAGSVGRPKGGDPRASYLVLQPGPLPRAEILRVAYDVARTVAAVERAGLPAKLVLALREGREMTAD